MPWKFAMIFAVSIAGASPTTLAAPFTPIDVVSPPPEDEAPWDADRMRRARERPKDVLPGRHT